MSDVSQKLGYIGLGIMGGPMAERLLDAGHALIVAARRPETADALVAHGAALAKSPADLAAQRPDVIFLNVTDTPDVEKLLFGEHGIAAGASPGLIVVDHSTISPVASKVFAHRLAEDHGVTFIDAPVSGGDVGAQNGTLSVMVGGPEKEFQKVRPLLDIVGGSVVHLGAAGMGQACKACNQVAAAGVLMGVVESMSLAKKLGLDPAQMVEVVGRGAAGSWQMNNLGPKINSGQHDPGFMIDYLLKDLAIVGDAARQSGLPLAFTALAESVFRAASANGDGELGTQAVARVYEILGGFSFT